jgi:hypothetical protein
MPEKAHAYPGVVGVLAKPFIPDALRAAVSAAWEIGAGHVPARIPAELRLFGNQPAKADEPAVPLIQAPVS